jgi:dimethylhistidine N-methyltransferase
MATSDLALQDFEPCQATFLEEVLDGLARQPKQLACKYFYDDWGSRLFEDICALKEYYPTRTELAIMREAIEPIVAAIGPESLLIEYGSGNSLKTCLLLDHAPRLAGYIPIDISRAQLLRAVEGLANLYPRLRVWPVCADYTQAYELPPLPDVAARRVVFFPGSTIGNFDPREAADFLRHIAAVCGPGGGLLIGVDLKKDPRLLAEAYNDPRGVTAAFNLNLLQRINRELGADFKLDRFAHYAFYNPRAGRIEMHLVSLADQVVRLGGRAIRFDLGESIWTESSYKYALKEFERLAAGAGLSVRGVWTDPARLFSVQYLAVEDDRGP